MNITEGTPQVAEQNIAEINIDTAETEINLDKVSKIDDDEDEIKSLKEKIKDLEREKEYVEKAIESEVN